jgi:hypothetical protein
MLDAETMMTSQSNRPTKRSARHEMSLRAGQQQQQHQELPDGGFNGNAHGIASQTSTHPSSLPALPISSLSTSTFGMVNWSSTTTALSMSRAGNYESGNDSVSRQQQQEQQVVQHGQEDHPRWTVLEPRSIEEMIARPLQWRRSQQHRQDDVEDDNLFISWNSNNIELQTLMHFTPVLQQKVPQVQETCLSCQKS